MVSEPIFWPPLLLPPKAADKTILATVTQLGKLKHLSTIKEYARQFESVLPYTHLPESTAIRVFINGLPLELQGLVRFFNPSRLFTAICFSDIHEQYGPKLILPQDDDDQDWGDLQVQEIDSNRNRIDEDDGVGTNDVKKPATNEPIIEALVELNAGGEDEEKREGISNLEVTNNNFNELEGPHGIESIEDECHFIKKDEQMINSNEPEKANTLFDSKTNLAIQALREKLLDQECKPSLLSMFTSRKMYSRNQKTLPLHFVGKIS